MLRHVVLFRFAPGTTDETREALVAALRALPARIPEIRDFQVDVDAGLREGNFELGVVALFEDEAGWRTYVDHPDHQAVVQDLIRPNVAERASVQFTV